MLHASDAAHDANCVSTSRAVMMSLLCSLSLFYYYPHQSANHLLVASQELIILTLVLLGKLCCQPTVFAMRQTIGVWGDIGETQNSTDTRNHLLANNPVSAFTYWKRLMCFQTVSRCFASARRGLTFPHQRAFFLNTTRFIGSEIPCPALAGHCLQLRRLRVRRCVEACSCSPRPCAAQVDTTLHACPPMTPAIGGCDSPTRYCTSAIHEEHVSEPHRIASVCQVQAEVCGPSCADNHAPTFILGADDGNLTAFAAGGYVGTDQERWDFWGRFMQPLIGTRPHQAVAGNHEEEMVRSEVSSLPRGNVCFTHGVCKQALLQRRLCTLITF